MRAHVCLSAHMRVCAWMPVCVCLPACANVYTRISYSCIHICHAPRCTCVCTFVECRGCIYACTACTSVLIFFFFFKKFTVFYLFIYLFIYDCVESSFLCEGFLQLRQVGATLHRGARASHHRGLSCCGAQAPDAQAQ